MSKQKESITILQSIKKNQNTGGKNLNQEIKVRMGGGGVILRLERQYKDKAKQNLN